MWQRWNGTSHVFEKSDDNGSSWAPLPLSAATITEGILAVARLPSTVAYTNVANIFTASEGNLILQPSNPNTIATWQFVNAGGGLNWIGTDNNVGGAFSSGAFGMTMYGGAPAGITLRANSGPIIFKAGGSVESGRFDTAGVLTASFGLAYNRGTISGPHATPVGLFTLGSTDQVALYLVRVGIGTSSHDALNYGAFATIAVEGNSARLVANNTSTVVIALSGMTVTGQQSSGGTSNIKWVALKIV